jgi:hypothetical protein
MGRGKNFNHKRKGHENQKPKHAPDVESASEPLAYENERQRNENR